MEPHLETCQPVFSCFLQFLHHSILYPHVRDAPLHCDPRLTHRVCGIFWNSKLSSVSSRMFFHSAAPFSRIVALRSSFDNRATTSPTSTKIVAGWIYTAAPSYRTFISSPFVHRPKRTQRTTTTRTKTESFVAIGDGQFYLPDRWISRVFRPRMPLPCSPKQRLAKQRYGYILVSREGGAWIASRFGFFTGTEKKGGTLP